MKIAIVSDTHDNEKNTKKFLNYAQKNHLDAIIHCGDVCRKETLNLILKNFHSKIYLSLGNGDVRNDFLEYKDNPMIEIFPHAGILDLPELNIAFAHYKDIAKTYSKKCDFIFYGHTHKPWVEQIGKAFIACPGNLAGINYAATFAVLDTITKKLELKILDKL